MVYLLSFCFFYFLKEELNNITIVKKILLISIILLSLHQVNTVDSDPNVKITIYSSACYSCVEEYFESLLSLEQEGLALIEFKHFYENPEAKNELEEIRERLNVPKDMQGFTTIVVNENFIFESEISVTMLEDFITLRMPFFNEIIVARRISVYEVIVNGGERNLCPELTFSECIEAQQRENALRSINLILVSGFLDGINPCAFSVLLLFIGLLTLNTGVDDNRTSILLMSSVYIATIFVTYLVIGLSLYNIIQVSKRALWITKLAGFITIIIGAINIFDFVFKRKFTTRIPFFGQMKIYDMLKRFTIPSTITAGILVAIFEFPCTGAVYFSIISLLASKQSSLEGPIYLILYNIAFIIPLLVIFGIVYLGKVEAISIGAREHRYLKLFSGIVFVLLGAIILFY
jgi:cytochrome c biogenesis protein CcdA